MRKLGTAGHLVAHHQTLRKDLDCVRDTLAGRQCGQDVGSGVGPLGELLYLSLPGDSGQRCWVSERGVGG